MVIKPNTSRGEELYRTGEREAESWNQLQGSSALFTERSLSWLHEDQVAWFCLAFCDVGSQLILPLDTLCGFGSKGSAPEARPAQDVLLGCTTRGAGM
jgi:hypothetical protein